MPLSVALRDSPIRPRSTFPACSSPKPSAAPSRPRDARSNCTTPPPRPSTSADGSCRTIKNTPKYRIPAPTILPAGGFLVFTEQDFNPQPGVLPSFNLSAAGDDAYIFSADSTGRLTGHRHGFKFGAALEGVSFGRHVTSDGQEHFVAQDQNTLGVSNALPRVGPLVISEIMYRPPDVLTNSAAWDNIEDEYVELCNISTVSVALYDLNAPTNTWRLRDAVDFSFPPSVMINPGERFVVVSFDPSNSTANAAFRSRYAVDANVRLFGPYTGNLSNGSDSVELVAADGVRESATNYVARSVLVDQVAYRDNAPWPAAADGLGLSLQRLAEDEYGNDPANWSASGPTPGRSDVAAPPPAITRQPLSQAVAAGARVTLSVEAAAPELLRFQWRFNGENLPGATAGQLILTNVQPSQAGLYEAVVSSPAAAAVSQPALIRLVTPPVLLRQPESIEVLASQSVELSVVAVGTSPLRYQWRRDGADIPGATRSILAFASVEARNAGAYDVIVHNDSDAVTSATAILRVVGQPVIVRQPWDATVAEGGTVTFGIEINPQASLPIRYRWVRDGAAVLERAVASHTDFLTLTNVRPADAGTYWVIVKNPGALASGITSENAALEVVVAPDADRDGLPDTFETDSHLNPNDPTDASSDTDGDGATNRDEYLAGTDPQDPESVLRIESIEIDSIVFQGVANRHYTVLGRDHPTLGFWETLARVPAVSGTSSAKRLIELSDPNDTPPNQRFYRVSTPGLSEP